MGKRQKIVGKQHVHCVRMLMGIRCWFKATTGQLTMSFSDVFLSKPLVKVIL